MKITSTLTQILVAGAVLSNAAPVMEDGRNADSSLSIATPLDARNYHGSDHALSISLEKRKGGGGRGSSGGSSSGSSSGGSSSGTSSSGSSSGRGSSDTSPSSNTGGRTSAGSGTSPSRGGYYPGGATAPYAAGAASPRGLGAARFLPVAALAFFPGIWLYGAYAYPYGHPWTYRNDTSGMNETRPVECLCAQYAECGCEDNSNATYVNSVVGDGSTAAARANGYTVADVNGTSTLLINGTLDNGTTASGATSGASSMTGKGAAVGWALIAAGVASSLSFMV